MNKNGMTVYYRHVSQNGMTVYYRHVSQNGMTVYYRHTLCASQNCDGRNPSFHFRLELVQ